VKAIFDPRYRRGIIERLGFISTEKKTKKRVLVHASSVGEVNVAYPFIKELMKCYDDCEVVLTVMTPEGYSLANDKLKDAATIFYFCLDFKSTVNRFLKSLDPDAVFIMETEIWPNFLRALKKRGVTVGIINGRMSEKSYAWYMRVRGFIKTVLENVDLFLVQQDEYKQRIQKITGDGERIKVTKNIKFDIDETFFKIDDDLLKMVAGLSYIVAASTHDGEEKKIMKIFLEIKALFPGLKLIIAPRHIKRCGDIEVLLRKNGLSYVKRSELSDDIDAGKYDVILVDTIGDLVTLFKAAKLAFMGGSLVNVGGHNIIEPAYFSVPTLFGRYMQNFIAAKELILSEGGAYAVKDELELKEKIVYLLQNKYERIDMGRRAKQALEKNRGALKNTMDEIKKRVEL
jgi:3-deoxy-D-manno-octulosonic-acid transferase